MEGARGPMLSTPTLFTVASAGQGCLEEAAAEILSLRQLVIALRREGCWCWGAGPGHTMATHSLACGLVTEYLAQRPLTAEEEAG